MNCSNGLYYPGNCCRNLLSDIFKGREEESSLVRLRVIQVSDLGHLKSQLYLIFKTSPWKDFIEAAPVPAGGKTNRQIVTRPLKIYVLGFEGCYLLGILHGLTQMSGSKYLQSSLLC